MRLYKELLEKAQSIKPRLIAMRRTIHQTPETEFDCQQTAAFGAAALEDAGWVATTGIGRTGVVGLLEGDAPGKTFLIRADMDAILVTEETGAPYASLIPGKMHACGHDAHTAMALGAA